MLNENAIGILLPSVGRLLGMVTTVGDRIKAAREAKGWNQAELARRLNVTAPTVSQLESGSSGAPSSETLLRMRDVGINPDYIMRGKGQKIIEDIEKKLKMDTLNSMIEELDEGETDMVSDVVRSIIRRKGSPSANDPFKTDPPPDKGTS